MKAYNDVRRLGGDPSANPSVDPLGVRYSTKTARTGTEFYPLNSSNETLKGIYWAYDGTALLCAPPRMYNEIATSVALREKPIHKVEDMAK